MVQSDIATVTVNGLPPEPCPYPLEGPIFQNYLLKCEAWEIVDRKTKMLSDVDMSLLLGGTLTWTMEYTKGNEITFPGHIFFNDQRLETATLTHGEPFKSGTIDLTGLIKKTNSVKIAIESSPLQWCEVSFSVWVTVCFSAEPEEPPIIEEPTPPISTNMKYAAIGGGAIVLALLLSRRGPQVVVIRE